MNAVLDALADLIQSGQPVVYTALVETRGSTPQKAGATMLVFPDGRQIGTLGGGCVEAEVKRKALQSFQGGQAELVTFQLDNNYGWDDGLICGGRMTMLIDPLASPGSKDYFRTYRQSSAAGCTEAVVLDMDKGGAPVGSRFLFNAQGDLLATSDGSGLPAPTSVLAGLKPLSQRPRPYVAGGVSYLTHLPRCRLVIIGAGHVGQRVAEYAAAVDFDVWVIDDRAEYCNADHIPAAKRLVVGSIEDTLAGLESDIDTFCIIVTRGHNHDEQALFHMIRKESRYLGMIGSKRKIKLIFEDLLQQGVPQALLDRVHAPLGLDIGSQTVPEIAISIVAELIRERNLGTAMTS